MSGGRVLPPRSAAPRVLVVGCGALANELVALTRDLPNVDVTCLPASLHNRPGGIPAAVRERIRRRRAGYDSVFVAYADCGTGGLLDRVIEEEGVERLPGAHCYEVFAGRVEFERLTDDDPATFFLTDFLVRNFDRLVWRGLGLDRYPELLEVYFGNYRRVVYLAQTDNEELTTRAREAAARLGLALERRLTGLDQLGAQIQAATEPAIAAKLPNTSQAGAFTERVTRHIRDGAEPGLADPFVSRKRLSARSESRIQPARGDIPPSRVVIRQNGDGMRRRVHPASVPTGAATTGSH